MVAVGCVAALGSVVFGSRVLVRSDNNESVPSIDQQQEPGDSVPSIEDPRANPAFDEAYAMACDQTILGLDAVYAAAAAAAPDLVATIDVHYQALIQRIASIHNRADLWSATDPLVLEFAETIADDLASILDGTEVGYDQLDGDIALFRSLCQDWFAPI